MLRLTVAYRNSDPPVMFTIEVKIHTLTLIKLAIKEQTGIEPEEQVLLHQDCLMYMEFVLGHHDLWDSPFISLYKRLPNDQLLNVTIRSRERMDRSFPVRVDLPVLGLKAYLARKLRVAPWKQRLVTLFAPMFDSDLVGSYTPTPQMDIFLQLAKVSSAAQTLNINVDDLEAGTVETYPLEEKDTLDVLLGYMELAHTLEQDEQPRLFRQGVQLDTSKSLQDYGFRDGEHHLLVKGVMTYAGFDSVNRPT